MSSILFGRNTSVVKREGGDGSVGNTKHQWRYRLIGKNGFWKEKVPRQALLTHSSDHRWVWTYR